MFSSSLYEVLFQSFFPQNIRIVTEAHANLKKTKTSCKHYFEALCSHGQVHSFGTFESFQSVLAGSMFHLFIINS